MYLNLVACQTYYGGSLFLDLYEDCTPESYIDRLNRVDAIYDPFIP